MGTNYYLHKDICNHCKRNGTLHIGKSSMGWKFYFQAMNEPFIHSVADWKREMKPADKIFDEYAREMTQDDFWKFVDAKQKDQKSHDSSCSNDEWEDGEGYDFSLRDFS